MGTFVLESESVITADLNTFGYFGGTFDPIHNGHLQMATELKQACCFEQMFLLPCRKPPHRSSPACSDAQRLEMARLAIADSNSLRLDDREYQRTSLSYTIDSLIELRRELGDSASISWCVGLDSLVNLNSWYRWRELLDYAHLVVVERPGWQIPVVGEVAQWLNRNRASADVLRSKSCGNVIVQSLSLVDVSATDIRGRIKSKKSVQFMLPDAVWLYVTQNQLYQND